MWNDYATPNDKKKRCNPCVSSKYKINRSGKKPQTSKPPSSCICSTREVTSQVSEDLWKTKKFLLRSSEKYKRCRSISHSLALLFFSVWHETEIRLLRQTVVVWFMIDIFTKCLIKTDNKLFFLYLTKWLKTKENLCEYRRVTHLFFCHKIPGDNPSPTILIAVRGFVLYILRGYITDAQKNVRLCPVTIEFFGYHSAGCFYSILTATYKSSRGGTCASNTCK